MASNLRVDTILPSSGTNVAIGTASGTVSLIGDSNLSTSGNLTIGGNLGVGGVLTYEDVTNVDSVGLITARSGIRIAAGSTVGPVSGIITYFGDGSQLTGISVDPSATASSDGFLKVLNASTPQIRLSNNASDNDDQQRSFFAIATGNNNFLSGSVANDTVLRARAGGDLVIGVGSTIRMRVDELGRVTKPNNVSYCVLADAGQNYSNDAIFIPPSPITTGVCHNIGGHFNTSNGVFTAPVAGRYWICLDAAYSGSSDSGTDGWQVNIQKNGSNSEIDSITFGGVQNGWEDHLRCDGILNLAAGDEIRFLMRGYGGSMTFTQQKHQGYLLG